MKTKLTSIKNNVNKKIDEAKNIISEESPKIKENIKKLKDSTEQNLKEGMNAVSRKVQEEIVEINKKNNHPIFNKEDIIEEHHPVMIRVIQADKRKELSGCENAIGFMKFHLLNILEIYENKINEYNYTFYPYAEQSVFYVDPINNCNFINLEEYFTMVKKAKVNELKNIAYSLGAKYFNVTFKVEKGNYVKQDINMKKSESLKLGKINNQSKIEGNASHKRDDFESIEIGAEMHFTGGESHMPELHYFKNDSDILSLIDMRLNKHNPIHSLDYKLKYSNSSQINLTIAAKIDEVLSKYKITGSVSASEQVKREQRTIMVYSIEF